MKHEMVKLEYKGLKFKVARPRLAELAIASVFTQALPAANVGLGAPSDIPALGAYWPGQGGINGGFQPAQGDVPEHYLIFATEDAGEHEWGRRGTESAATSKWDGKANTDALIASGSHPAAQAARAYTADGHADFDLPAASQLYQAWVHGLITGGSYWSSSQRSADLAFSMPFGGGLQDYGVKGTELLVRPVRRLFL